MSQAFSGASCELLKCIKNKKYGAETSNEDETMVNKKVHCVLAIVAGIIAFLAGLTGSIELYEMLLPLAVYAPAEVAQTLNLIVLILGILASLGGIIVILGGLLILANRFFIGRFCIGLGVGFEAMSAIFDVALTAIGGVLITALVGFVVLLTTLTGIAFILAIAVLVVPISKDKL